MNRLIRMIPFTVFLLILLSGAVYAENLDTQLFHLINRDLHSPYLDSPMLLTTHTSNGVLGVLTVGGLYLAGETDTAVLLSSAIAKTAWTTYTLKYLVSRPRPGLTLDDVNYIDGYVVKDHESFPSGHTALAFTIASVLSEQYPTYAPYLYTYAALVGISRVYVGAHYPSDVLAGALLGYYVGKNTIHHRNLILGGNFLLYTIRF